MNTIEYRIRSGDTLSMIARRHAVTVEALARLNGISDASRIWAGQILRIPTKPPSQPPQRMSESQTYRVRAGDTLSEIARSNNVTVDALVQANDIRNPDRIGIGLVLRIPKGSPSETVTKLPSTQSSTSQAPKPSGKASGSAASNTSSRAATEPALLKLELSGVPLYQQDDKRWGSHKLGGELDIANYGCAMTATAMAISKIGGQPITPGQLDDYLDAHEGYSGDSLLWDAAAAARGLGATWPFPDWSLQTIDSELAAGRPVVVGVHHKGGSEGGRWGTDHWVTLTGKGTEKGKTVYSAHDPASGKRFLFTVNGQMLEATPAMGAAANYSTTGELRTFFSRSTSNATSTASLEREGHIAALGSLQPGGNAPSLASVRSGKKVLGVGMKGPAVKEVQRLLVRAGYLTQKQMDSGPGRYGPATRTAVTEFQRRTKIWTIGNSRGVVDRRTLGALFGASPVNGQSTPGGSSTTKPGQGKTSQLGLLTNPYWQQYPRTWEQQRPIWLDLEKTLSTPSTKTPVTSANAVKTPVKAAPQVSPKSDSWMGSILDWLWGTLQGDFNPNPSKSQIVVNMVLGLIPLVDQVLDIRDIIAGMKDLIEYYMEDASAQKSHPATLGLSHEVWLWVNVFIIAIGAIPMAGSIIKGALKTLISFLQDLGKNAGGLSAGQVKALLKHLGLKEDEVLKQLKYITGELKGWMDQALSRIKSGLDLLGSFLAQAKEYANKNYIQYPAKWLGLKKELDQFIAGIDKLKQAIQKSHDRLDTMKTEVNRWLGDQVGTLIQPKQLPAKNATTVTKADPSSVNTRAPGQTGGPEGTGGQRGTQSTNPRGAQDRNEWTPVSNTSSQKRGASNGNSGASNKSSTTEDSKKSTSGTPGKQFTNKEMDDAKFEELLRKFPEQEWENIQPFIGSRIPKKSSDKYKAFVEQAGKAGYFLRERNGSVELVRLSKQKTQIELTVINGDLVVLKVDRSTRLSVPSKARKNYLDWVEETQGKKIRDEIQQRIGKEGGYQLHHLIPDDIAQKNELIREALGRVDKYTIDRGENILDMPSASKQGKNYVHLGGHPKYSKLVEDELTDALKELKAGNRKLEDILPSEIEAAIRKVEKKLREMIEKNDPRIPTIKYNLNGEEVDKLARLGGRGQREEFTT